MDITKFWSRGVSLSGVNQRREALDREAVQAAAEAARSQWLNALLVDELRAWEDIGEAQREVLNGLLVTLTIAGLCKAHGDGNEKSPQVRVIRGGVRVVEDCVTRAGCRVSATSAMGLSSAVNAAREVIRAASIESITSAAVAMRRIAGIQTPNF